MIGGWDAEMGKRSMVKLPELKPDQRRRQIYFFRTHEQMVKKLGQYADKAALLGEILLCYIMLSIQN